MSDEGIDAFGVPFCYPVGCDVGCVLLAVMVASPHRIAWVRGLHCRGVMLWFGAGSRCSWSLRAHYLARWGPACGFPLICPAVYVLCSYCFALWDGVIFFLFS